MKNSFDTLPEAVQEILKKVDTLTELVRVLTPHTPPPTSDTLLNVKETAKFLDLSVPTIYSKVNRGELPYSKVGKRLYFSKKELMSYIKSGKVLSNNEIEQIANNYMLTSKKSE